ncbi:MAG: tRNA (adenosine(37)-N6)-dimethylallyltransferase MiaA [Boseongicola sp.]|nr:tRNA (adenosine(37)-N6)-dimethylallyltransferase MiaA [Boseongicola sp.]NNJ69511.1 tRNA (adenosine(37)-N6)-dimethylallyltransferase MiaA [Boseongicola sp.]
MNLTKSLIGTLSAEHPVLIAGPTASGKSRLAMEIAAHFGAPVVNADALQVYKNWRILTARPSVADEAAIKHQLYGHVAGSQAYSAGDWLRDVSPLLKGKAPVIVGGTGLYFSALTEGLADIPATPDAIRQEGDALLADQGLGALLDALDDETRERIDTANKRRVQRAWEVLKATGRGLASWQDETGASLLPFASKQALVLSAPKQWLTPRIAQRFDLMMDTGLIEEARANADNFNPSLASSKAIGAKEIVGHLKGKQDLEATKEAIIVQTRQYAKRQRSWFRSRMKAWRWIEASDL